MKYFMVWLRFVARLVVAYSLVGVFGAIVAFAAITAYAYPHAAMHFALGAITAGGAFLAGRRAQRAHRDGSDHPVVASIRAFMSEGGYQNHGRAI